MFLFLLNIGLANEEVVYDNGDNDDQSMTSDEDDYQQKQEQPNTTKKPLTRAPGLHHSPSKRISLKGEAFTLMENLTFSNNKKRRITLEFSTGITGTSRKISCKDNSGVDSFDGVDGKFTYKEV